MSSYRVALLSSEDPFDKKVWSGTLHSIYRNLSARHKVEVVRVQKPFWLLLYLKLKNQVRLLLSGKRISYRHSLHLSGYYGKKFGRALRDKKIDFIVAPAASAEIAFLRTEIPIIYVTDGTFASCLNYHRSLSNLTEKSIREGNEVERRAFFNSRLVVVSSRWTADSFEGHYGADQAKLRVLPFGANLDKVPSDIGSIKAPSVWRILFPAVNWKNKGGDIAYRAFSILSGKGLKVKLTVLGTEPPPGIQHPDLEIVPFIDKNDPGSSARFFSLYSEHHFVILPTRFDCTPIVICEASAFAVPSIVADTGGVRGHLEDGVNGHLIRYDDQGEGYAAVIERLMENEDEYARLRTTSRKLYEERLNWDHWSSAIATAMEQEKQTA
jgi:glycosyltransferase involved in cell wall biosynthesis